MDATEGPAPFLERMTKYWQPSQSSDPTTALYSPQSHLPSRAYNTSCNKYIILS